MTVNTMMLLVQKIFNSLMMVICSTVTQLTWKGSDGKVLTVKMITMMHTVAGAGTGGGGAILDDDILSPESEAGRS